MHPRPRGLAPTPIHASTGGDTVSFSADDLKSNNPRSNIGKALAYKGLTVAFVAAGGALIAYPESSIQFLFDACPAVARRATTSTYVGGAPTLLILVLTRALGAIHLLAATATFALGNAAFSARLSSDTYKRLNLGLFTWSLASFAALYTAPVALAAAAAPAVTALLATAAALPIILGKNILGTLPPLPQTWPIFSAINLYGSGASIALIFALAVAYAFFVPGVLHVTYLTAPLGPLGITLLRLLGAGGVLTWLVLLTQQEAARRGRLGASTFKQLNLGLAFLSGTILELWVSSVKMGLVKWPEVPTNVLEWTVGNWLNSLSLVGLNMAFFLVVFGIYFALTAKKK